MGVMRREFEVIGASFMPAHQAPNQLSFSGRKEADLSLACAVGNNDIFVRMVVALFGGASTLWLRFGILAPIKAIDFYI